MDMSVYSNYLLVRGTLDLCRRIKRENPALWEQIQAEAALEKQRRENALAQTKEVTEDGKETLPR